MTKNTGGYEVRDARDELRFRVFQKCIIYKIHVPQTLMLISDTLMTFLCSCLLCSVLKFKNTS